MATIFLSHHVPSILQLVEQLRCLFVGIPILSPAYSIQKAGDGKDCQRGKEVLCEEAVKGDEGSIYPSSCEKSEGLMSTPNACL